MQFSKHLSQFRRLNAVVCCFAPVVTNSMKAMKPAVTYGLRLGGPRPRARPKY